MHRNETKRIQLCSNDLRPLQRCVPLAIWYKPMTLLVKQSHAYGQRKSATGRGPKTPIVTHTRAQSPSKSNNVAKLKNIKYIICVNCVVGGEMTPISVCVGSAPRHSGLPFYGAARGTRKEHMASGVKSGCTTLPSPLVEKPHPRYAMPGPIKHRAPPPDKIPAGRAAPCSKRWR